MRHLVIVTAWLVGLPAWGQQAPSAPTGTDAPPPADTRAGIEGSPEVQEPAVGFGRVATPEELLERLERLEASVAANAQVRPSTAAQADAMAASLERIDQRLETLQQQAEVAEAAELVERERALAQASMAGEAINSLQIADAALSFGEDDSTVLSALAAASLALDQLAVDAEAQGRPVEQSHAQRARAAVDGALVAVDNDDVSRARAALSQAYRDTLAAQTHAGTR